MSDGGWIYVGLCPGCGEVSEAVLGDWPDEIARMVMAGLIVMRRSGRVGRGCFCPAPAPRDARDVLLMMAHRGLRAEREARERAEAEVRAADDVAAAAIETRFAAEAERDRLSLRVEKLEAALETAEKALGKIRVGACDRVKGHADCDGGCEYIAAEACYVVRAALREDEEKA